MRSRTIMEAELAFNKGLLESSQYRDPGFTAPAPRSKSLVALSGCIPGKAGDQ